MGLLSGTTTYLSGPIESAIDASSWRENIKPDLKLLGIEAWDPLVKPGWMRSDADGSKQRKWKNRLIQSSEADPHDHSFTDIQSIYETNHQIRTAARRLASACDFMICRITGEFTAGTFEELSAS